MSLSRRFLSAIDRVSPASVGHAHVGLVREVIAACSDSALDSQLWAYIEPRLDDGETFRRYAELLSVLNRLDDLALLTSLALVSEDSEIREVGQDFRPL